MLDWQVGVFYFHEHQLAGSDAPLSLSFLSQPLPLFPVGIGLYNSGIQDTDSGAIYGTMRYHITDKLDVEPGVRYSYETKTTPSGAFTDFFTPAPLPLAPLPAYPFPAAATLARQSDHWGSFTPAFTVDYKLLDDVLLFARYAKGFKSGGFNLGYDQAPFNPETVKSYEAGVKSAWLDHRLTANLSGFYYSYSNLQVQELLGLELEIVNAARATVKGVELSIAAMPIQQLRFDVSVGLLDAKYDNYASIDPARSDLGILNLAGNTLTNAAPYTGNVSGEYTVPTPLGSFALRAESRLVAKTYLSQYNLTSQSAPKTSTTNLLLRYVDPSARWTVSLWAKNLENKVVPTADSVTAGGGDPITGSLSPPRTYGVTVRYDR
jgi:iron complex outermembrane receptor protein